MLFCIIFFGFVFFNLSDLSSCALSNSMLPRCSKACYVLPLSSSFVRFDEVFAVLLDQCPQDNDGGCHGLPQSKIGGMTWGDLGRKFHCKENAARVSGDK